MAHPRVAAALRSWWVVAAVCAVPILANALRAATVGWTATFDTAFLQIRVLDVGTSATPLVGVPSTISGSAAHPGPLQMWMLAPGVRLLRWTPLAIMLAQALLNAAWIGAAVRVTKAASTRVPARAVFAGALALVVSLGTEVAHDPWNPHAAVVPFAVALWCTALAVTGGHRAAWLAVLAAGMSAQAHLTYTLPGALLTLTALGAAALAWRRGVEGARRSTITAGVVTLAAWSGPIIREFVGPSNVSALMSSSGEDAAGRLGWRTATDRLVWFLRPDGLLFDRHITADELIRRASPVAVAVTLAALAMLAWAAIRIAPRRPEIAALAAVGGACIAIVWATTAVMPATMATLFGVNTMRAYGPPALALWVAAAACVVDAVHVRRGATVPQRSRMLWNLGCVAALVLVTANAVVWPVGHERDGAWFDITRATNDALPDDLSTRHLELVTVGVPLESAIGAGVFSDLVRRGVDVVARGPVSTGLVHPSHLVDDDSDTPREQLVLAVAPTASAPAASADEIARVTRTVEGEELTVVVLLTPPGG